MAANPTEIRETVESWDRERVTLLAQQYGSDYGAHHEKQRWFDSVKASLRRWMQLNGDNELVDEETGFGVKLDPPMRTTTWDVASMPWEMVRQLHILNLLDVRTAPFDAMRRAGSLTVLDDADRKYRITGEREQALRAVTPKDGAR